MMSKIRPFLLAILVVFTSLFGTACESDEEQDEPPQVRQQADAEVQGGDQGGEEAPLDQEAGDVVEEAGESDVSGVESIAGEVESPDVDCLPESEVPQEEGCVDPESLPQEEEFPQS